MVAPSSTMPDAVLSIYSSTYGMAPHGGKPHAAVDAIQPTPFANVKANASSQPAATNSPLTVDEVDEDVVPRLRSVKSILKTSSLSADLDSPAGSASVKRAVSWHDFEGKNLHTVREYTPAEGDDDELLFNPGEAKACCVIC